MPELKPFQVVGAKFLAERSRALLADEPGVGKTAQVVAACDLVGARTVLVVCPAIGVRHWSREFQKWSTTKPEVSVMSYDQARKEAKILADFGERYDVLVPDECHYAKNPNAKRTHAVFAKGGLGWYADRIWSLSGTPAPNHAGELWPMLRAYGATKLDYPEFVNYFCNIDWQGKIRGSRMDRVEELKAIIAPFALRRKKVDVLPELGAVDVQNWYVDQRSDFMTAADASESLTALERQIRGLAEHEILEFLTSHEHEFSTLRRYNALLKVPAVLDAVTFEIAAGLLDKVVVYGYHKEPLDILHRKFNAAGVGAVVIHGGTPAKERDGLVQQWKQPGGPRVMLASIIAAGTVLDFTEAHQGIMLELDWVPGNNAQAMQRMHRHGQTKPVTIRVAIGGDVDEQVSDVVVRKTRELTALFG